MSEMLRRDMSCEGLLECFHDLEGIDREVFTLLTESDEALTVDEIVGEMQRTLDDWYAKVGQFAAEFEAKYGGDGSDRAVAAER